MFNAVCNLERIIIFVMILVLMIPEITMICTTKNTMEKRLIDNIAPNMITIACNYVIPSFLPEIPKVLLLVYVCASSSELREIFRVSLTLENYVGQNKKV